ncbi:hypothetical protein OG552_15905 [Streptomyces sp. NBC_01476]|uniref:hypothetical protein n=1 Tax=Streptomyces sp. NBC_01476 TaxID=2903881 RepID=UPI002E353253|nr:hypothetical protein [Streptomyces sp. NBC_01476]
MKLKKSLMVTALACAFGLGVVSPAHAGTGLENQESPEACQKTQAASTFKFAIYYNSNYGGAYRNIGYSVYDFADERIGGAPQGGLQPLLFCHGGAGNLQGIKNNAASAKNKHPTYYSVVYYNSGYKGDSDWIAPNSGWSQLAGTYNENASFAWQSL